MGLCFLEKNCHRKSEISFLPSLKAKFLFPVCDGIPCSFKKINSDAVLLGGRGYFLNYWDIFKTVGGVAPKETYV